MTKPGTGCKRGIATVDQNGLLFVHLRDPLSKICVFCGDGSPAPSVAAYEKAPDTIRIETVSCEIHGSHRLEVRPDGKYDKPDCEMFA